MGVHIVRTIIVKGKGKRKQVLAVENMEFPPERRWYGLPGGTVHATEKTVHGAQRETKEETGYTVGGLEEVYAEKRKGRHHHYFKVKRRRGRKKVEPTYGTGGLLEDGPPRWIPLEDIRQGVVPFHPSHVRVLEQVGIL